MWAARGEGVGSEQRGETEGAEAAAEGLDHLPAREKGSNPTPQPPPRSGEGELVCR